MYARWIQRIRAASAALLAAVSLAAADDWPTYHHDHQRSGVTPEKLTLPLNEAWRHLSRHAPRPAWPEPASEDIWHGYIDLKGAVKYDRANHVVVVGDALYFGSSADDTVTRLDAATGKVRWRFFTDGPVRLAPEILAGKVYFGSDDGCAYCLSAGDGSLVWKQRIAPTDRRIPGNGRLISDAPIRTGVLVEGDIAYCFAGLFPAQKVYACALKAGEGAVLWRKQNESVSPQGYLLASSSRLYVPTGRTAPAIFDRGTGEHLGSLPGAGGAYALLTGDALVSGPGRAPGSVTRADTEAKESIASFDGLRMIVHRGMAYLQSAKSLSALDRTRYLALGREKKTLSARKAEIGTQLTSEEDDARAADLRGEQERVGEALARVSKDMAACYKWKQPSEYPYALILAGDVLFAGGDGRVAALGLDDGRELWAADVQGKAYGLTVANGRLFVSTDAGVIHCFSPGAAQPARTVSPGDPVDPYPDDPLTGLCSQAAERLVEATGIRQGYCLVLDCGDGRLAYEIAKRTELRIVGIEDDEKQVAAAREALDKAGMYGSRVTVHHGGTGRLPYGSYAANLLVSQGALVSGELPPAGEALRVLRPYGGIAYFGGALTGNDVTPSRLREWVEEASIPECTVDGTDALGPFVRRGALPGAGEWTQLYADASNTANSNDQLRGPMMIQWFGEPGPRSMIDRHLRPMPPLVKSGRVFIPANDVVICVDAYNGIVLWDLDAPNMRRVGALKDSGHVLVTDDLLYVAVEDECWAVDVATGVRSLTFKAPQLSADRSHHWGYLNRVGDRLIGSGQRVSASRRGLSVSVVSSIYGDFLPVMISEYLFALDRHAGDALWTYRGGAVVNSAATAGDGRLYFVESRSSDVLADEDGRIGVDVFCKGETHLVALNVSTGEKAWERPFSFPFEHVMYASYGDGVLLISGSRNVDGRVQHELFAFDGETGRDRWHAGYQSDQGIDGSHGEQDQHPVIVGGKVYSRPFVFDLRTGEQGSYVFDSGGHGCGGLSGSAYYLYGRGGNPRMYDLSLDETDGTPLTHTTRPGCWINMIPACGVLVIPEYSSGCTCAYPIQASVAFAPANAP